MEERLVPEVSVEESKPDLVEERFEDLGMDDSVLTPETRALIARCMNGSEPFVQEKDYFYHVVKFSIKHVQMVLLRFAGFKNVEIAEMLGVGPMNVGMTLQHPYAKKIIAAMLPQHSTRVIDIRTRLEINAFELLEHVTELAKKSDDIAEVRQVSFGLLDRAGHAPVQRMAVATGKPADFAQADSRLLHRVASALEESSTLDQHIMPQWKPPRPPDELEAPHEVLPGPGGNEKSSTDSASLNPQRTGTND